MFFVLLLAAASLNAQTSTGNAPAVLVLPPTTQSCPVKLTVDRKPWGAVIETSDELDWINRHSNLSLPELQRSFENEPGFSSLTSAAQQESLARLAQLYNARHGQGGQGLDIDFARPESQIVSADIVVHGYPPTAHVIPATPSAPSEVTETFHLTAAAGKPLLHSSIWTAHMIMVNWVELTRLVYANGTTWQPTTPRQCEASPSPYVLVNSTH
jgi:hypothetical protein